MIQNVFMYLDSIVCNLLLLGGKGDLADAFTTEALSSLMSPLVLLLILNNAVLGIVTSLFLQVIQSFAQFHIFFAETKLGCESLCVCLRAGHNSIGETDRDKQGEYCTSAISSDSNRSQFEVSWPVLGIPLTLHTVVALSAICTAVVIYAQV